MQIKLENGRFGQLFGSYVVIQSFRCTWTDGNVIRQVTVPRGFVSDGATDAPDKGTGWLYHDYLYTVTRWDDQTQCSRQEADQLMALILETEGFLFYARGFRLVAACDPCHAFSHRFGTP